MKKDFRHYSFYVCSHNFNGKGRGFCVPFNSGFAAFLFATWILFGFAEVVPWWYFWNRFPTYKQPKP